MVLDLEIVSGPPKFISTYPQWWIQHQFFFFLGGGHRLFFGGCTLAREAIVLYQSPRYNEIYRFWVCVHPHDGSTPAYPGSQVAKKAVTCVTRPREIALLWNGPGRFETPEVGNFSE